MSSYDLYLPKEKYVETEKNLLSMAENFYTKAKQAERSSDKSTRSTAHALRAQKERYQITASELKKERAVQEIIFRYTMDVEAGRFEKEKNHWFPHGTDPLSFTSCINLLK